MLDCVIVIVISLNRREKSLIANAYAGLTQSGWSVRRWKQCVLQHVRGFEGIWEAGHLLIPVHKLVFQYDAGFIKATQRSSLSWSQHKPFTLFVFCACLLYTHTLCSCFFLLETFDDFCFCSWEKDLSNLVSRVSNVTCCSQQ